MQPVNLPSTIAGVDVATGLTRVAGNQKLFKRLLIQVADDAVNIREKINTAIMAGDFVAVREQAHSLKGSSGNLAITDVFAAAEVLESSAKKEDFPQVFQAFDSLEQALEAYCAAIAPLRA